MDARVECQPDPGSVRTARRFVVDLLQDRGADDIVDSAALLTSELATNAVLHTRRPFTIEVRFLDGAVRVGVVDRSEEIPHLPRHLAPSGPSGSTTGDLLTERGDDRLFSGLGMVDAVATRWGADPRPGEGKVVWFELALHEQAGPGALSSLRHLGDERDRLVADLPPLEVEGLDDLRRATALRTLGLVALLAVVAAAVYGGLRAGGVLGAVWYGH